MNTVSKTVTVKLDKERTMTYGKRAEYLMSTLPRPFSVQDFKVKRRSGGALIAWVWASLDDQRAFGTPEELAEIMMDLAPSEVTEVFRLFCETYAAAQVPEEGSPKTNGSTNSPSPSSSSV